MLKKYTFDGTRTLDLSKMNTGAKKDDVIKEEIVQKTTVNQLAIQALQDKLYADQRQGLIILIQARDAAGKDSTIKHVMSGINPQGVDVYSFKQPTADELAHDFLWRVNRHIPRRGKIAIYNRSYYEDVLVVQVRNLHQTYMLPAKITEDPDFFQKRYKQIRHYEKYLHQNGYRIVKIFLNVSKKTQKERFLERIENPDKNWKFSESDVKERKLWDQYTKAYEDAINATSSKTAPWYVIPADKKWYTRFLVSQIIRKALEEMDPQYPRMPEGQKERLEMYKEELEHEDDKLRTGSGDKKTTAGKDEKAQKAAADESEKADAGGTGSASTEKAVTKIKDHQTAAGNSEPGKAGEPQRTDVSEMAKEPKKAGSLEKPKKAEKTEKAVHKPSRHRRKGKPHHKKKQDGNKEAVPEKKKADSAEKD